MFLFTSLYPFFRSKFERAKVNNIPILRELSVYTNGHGVIIIGIIGFRFATLLHHSLVQLCCKFKAWGLQIYRDIVIGLQKFDRVSDSCACALQTSPRGAFYFSLTSFIVGTIQKNQHCFYGECCKKPSRSLETRIVRVVCLPLQVKMVVQVERFVYVFELALQLVQFVSYSEIRIIIII